MLALMSGFEDRDTKIANYKLKKMLEQNLERLKDYQDEEAQREFYKSQIQFAIMGALDQLVSTEMEIKILQHKSSLSVEDHRKNEVLSSKKETTPLQVQYIGVSYLIHVA